MRISRIIVVLLVIVVIAIIAIAAYSALTPTSTSPWKSTADYPLQASEGPGVFAQQCLNSTSYVYCIGGQDADSTPNNAVYSSSAITSSSANITSWTLDSNPYPQSIYGQSCVASSSYIYCVGGTYDDKGDDVNASYYASVTSDGVVGKWSSTTSFPIPVDAQSCVESSGYIYCVGGYDEALGTNASSFPSYSVYYASVSSSGIGSWSESTSYPAGTYLPSCFAANGHIYCLGGVDSSTGNAVSTDYYAPLSSAGVGTWTQTTAYPIQATDQACAISSGYIYCVGGVGSSGSFTNAVYYATVSSGGIGTWIKGANYPDSASTDCVILSSNLYCVGGADSSGLSAASYYISLGSLVTTTT